MDISTIVVFWHKNKHEFKFKCVNMKRNSPAAYMTASMMEEIHAIWL